MMEINKIYNHTAEGMGEVENDSVDLIISSPPYNANIEYDVYHDTQEIPIYKQLLENVFKECFRKLKPGGRKLND